MPGGRPTLLTPESQRKILSAIRKGNYRSAACHAGGIDYDTMLGWIERGNRGIEPYAEFSGALKKAEAYAERKLVSEIRRGVDAWVSRAWILERTRPAKWSGRVKATVYDEMQALLAKLKDRLDPETWLRVISVISDTEEAGDTGAASPPVAAKREPPEHRGTA